METLRSLCSCPAFHTLGDEKDMHRNDIPVLISVQEGPFQKRRRCQFARAGVNEKDQNTHMHFHNI